MIEPSAPFSLVGLALFVVKVKGNPMIKDALEDVKDSQKFFTITLNIAPLSTEVAGGVVYVADVASAMAAPFLYH